MSGVPRIHVGRIERRWAKELELYDSDSECFETGDLIYFADKKCFRVWPEKQRYYASAAVPIDGTNIKSCVEWLVAIRQFLAKQPSGHWAFRFNFLFEFSIDHPLAAELLGFQPPSRWTGIRARFHHQSDEFDNLHVLFSRAKTHWRCLPLQLCNGVRDPLVIRAFFEQAEKRIIGGTGYLDVLVEATTTRFGSMTMVLASGWRTVRTDLISCDRRTYHLQGPLSQIDRQVYRLEENMSEFYAIYMRCPREITSYPQAHNFLVDLMMSIGQLDLPLYVIMWIANFVPGMEPWSAYAKLETLKSMRESMLGVKQGRHRQRYNRVWFADRRPLSDIRWYEMSAPGTPVVYGRNVLNCDYRQPRHQKRTATSDRAASSVKKTNHNLD